MDPFRPPSNQGYEGYGGQQRMGMNDMAGGVGLGGMMHPNSNMMQNSQMQYGGGMVPNNTMPPSTGGMPNNNMMPNSNMPTPQGNVQNMNSVGMPVNSSQNSMMPNRPVGMPSSSGENITVQDPFADNVQMGSTTNQFQRPAGSQLPPYSSSGMAPQPQPNMPSNSGGYFNRQQQQPQQQQQQQPSNMGNNAMGYSGHQQQQPGMGGQPQQGPYNNNNMSADPYRRGMGPGMMPQAGPQQAGQQQVSGAQPDGYNQFNNRQNAMGQASTGVNSQQFPFGTSSDRFVLVLVVFGCLAQLSFVAFVSVKGFGINQRFLVSA